MFELKVFALTVALAVGGIYLLMDVWSDRREARRKETRHKRPPPRLYVWPEHAARHTGPGRIDRSQH